MWRWPAASRSYAPALGLILALGWPSLSASKARDEEELGVEGLRWPVTAEHFELMPLELPANNAYAASTRKAGILANPRGIDRSSPLLLLSQLPKSSTHSVCDFKPHQVSVLRGPPASGKTRALIELANSSSSSDFPLYLNCSPRYHLDVFHALNSTEAPEQGMVKVIRIRQRVLREAQKRYGASFLPRHWLALQLFPQELMGKDIFLSLLQHEAEERLPWTSDFKAARPLLLIDQAELVPPDVLEPVLESLEEWPIVVATNQIGDHVEQAAGPNRATSTFKRAPNDVYWSATTTEEKLRAWGLFDVSPLLAAGFQGRPGHAAVLFESSVALGRLAENEARDRIVAMHAQALESLRVSAAAEGWESLYALLRRAALDFSLGGKGAVCANAGVVDALDQCVCRLAKSDEGRVSCNEPLMLQALSQHASLAFAASSSESSALGFEFENHLARVNHELIALISNEDQLRKLDPRFEGWRGQGKWKAPALGADGRLARRAKSGHEPKMVLECLSNADAGVPGIVMPATDMGPDLILVAKPVNSSYGRTLVVLVQAKASVGVSTSKALLSLTKLYATHRGTKNETLPLRFFKAERDMEALLQRRDVVVVRMLVKYPARSKPGTRHVRAEPDGSLTVVIDGQAIDTDALNESPLLRRGFEVLDKLKK